MSLRCSFFFTVLDIKVKALGTQGKCSTTEPVSSAPSSLNVEVTNTQNLLGEGTIALSRKQGSG